MKNVKLGRKILDIVDGDPEHFAMETFGKRTDCGTVACLAGHAMLLSGYTLVSYEDYYRPDGSRVEGSAREAMKLLGMEYEEAYFQADPEATDPDVSEIWYDMDHGPDRFRKLVEESEGHGE